MSQPKQTFAVIGLGTFGLAAARALHRGGASVLAIDKDDDAVQLAMGFATEAVCLDALDDSAMRACGAYDIQTAIISVRRKFDISVLITHAMKAAGVPRLLVLVDSDQEASAIRVLGASDVIFPEKDMARRVVQDILFPDLAGQIPLGSGVGILELAMPASFVGKTLVDINLRRTYGLNVIAISVADPNSPEGRVVDAAPDPTTPLDASTRLLVMGRAEKLSAFKASVK